MPVQNPGRRLMHFVPLKFVQKRVSGGSHRSTNAALSLTSMIDFLVVTVVFLLITFDASGEKPLNKGVNLPKAENVVDMIDAPIVAVTSGQIFVNGNPAGKTGRVEESKHIERIDELFGALKAIRDTWKQLHPQKEFPGVVILQIDQEVPAVVVKSIFQTAAFAGYPNVSFEVNSLPKTANQ